MMNRPPGTSSLWKDDLLHRPKRQPLPSRLNAGAKVGDCSRRVRVQLLPVLPPQHRRHNLWLQTVARTEMGGRYEIDGCEFGNVKAHSLGGVEHFAFTGIVDENLKVLWTFLNHDSQSIPFGFVSLPVPHRRQS